MSDKQLGTAASKSPAVTVVMQPVFKFSVSTALKAPAPVDLATAVATWGELKAAIQQIYSQNASKLSFEALHRRAYNLTLHKHGELLYDGVTQTVREHLLDVAAELRAAPDALLLQRLKDAWDAHSRDIGRIRDILMYMERSYVANNRKPGTLELGTALFRDAVLRDEGVQPRLRRLLLDAMRAARSGELVEPLLIRSVLGLLVDLGLGTTAVYAEEFERPFLEQTEAFYREESADALARNSSTVEYLKYAERRLAEEAGRAVLLLHPASAPRLVELCQRELVAAHALRIVDMEGSGFLYLLEHERMDDLNRMYRLFSAVRSLVTWKSAAETRERSLPPGAVLRDSMKAHVTERGLAVVRDSECRRDPVVFVQALLDLRDKYMRIIDAAFDGDKDFHRAVKDAFENVMNAEGQSGESRAAGSGVNVCAEFLSVYVDEHMKRLFKDMTEAAIDDRLSKVITLFRFVRDKDVFEAYYKQHLTKRLLGNRTSGEDAERLMLSKLKTECGFQYTSKLEGMFNDLKTSADFMAVFRREFKGNAGSAVPAGVAAAAPASRCELDVSVLTSGFWPIASDAPCRLPTDVSAAVAQFEGYYLSKHSGRRLRWNMLKGSAELRAVFGTPEAPRRHELSVSTYQMCALMLFNDTEELSFRSMQSALGVAGDELKRHVMSLLNPKCRVLLKKPGPLTPAKAAADNVGASLDLDDNDILFVNVEFSSKLVKVKVPLISMKSALAVTNASGKPIGGGTAAAVGGASSSATAGDADGSDIPGQVEEARKHLLEAAIVRTMKTRKTMEHASLVAEVIKQVSMRFQPSPVDIKKRIEGLIDRDYMERDKDSKNLYHYLA